jgi:hypothetical protein
MKHLFLTDSIHSDKHCRLQREQKFTPARQKNRIYYNEMLSLKTCKPADRGTPAIISNFAKP